MNARPLSSLEAAWPTICRALMSAGRLPRTDALYQSAKLRLSREIAAAHDERELADRWKVSDRQVRRVVGRYYPNLDTRPKYKPRPRAEHDE